MVMAKKNTKKKKSRPKSDPRSDANYPIMNICGWFLPEIAVPKDLMVALIKPLAGHTDRRAKCNTFQSYDDHAKASSLSLSDAVNYFQSRASHVENYIDNSDFGITLGPASENAGAKSPPDADLRFGIPFLERLARGKFRTIPYVKQVFESFDADGNCFFALANADVGYENRWGTLYSIFPKQRMSCQKHIDYFRWYDILNGPQDQVRGVYWGTFIGSKLAKKLPRSIVDDFNALSDPYAGSPQHAAWLPNGSVYFLLNDDPRVNYDEEIEPPTGLDNMYTNCGVWLARQLHKAGIF